MCELCDMVEAGELTGDGHLMASAYFRALGYPPGMKILEHDWLEVLRLVKMEQRRCLDAMSEAYPSFDEKSKIAQLGHQYNDWYQ
jgi:hypothetical protein